MLKEKEVERKELNGEIMLGAIWELIGIIIGLIILTTLLMFATISFIVLIKNCFVELKMIIKNAIDKLK